MSLEDIPTESYVNCGGLTQAVSKSNSISSWDKDYFYDILAKQNKNCFLSIS